MDCRKSLVLALGLVGAAGCVADNSTQTGPVLPPPGAVIEKAKDPPKHPPKSAETCVALGNVFASEGASKPQASAVQGHLYDQARREYQQALDVDAGCRSAYLALGQLYTKMGDHDGAVRWYRKGLEKLPREGSLWLHLGLCHASHKDWNLAIDAHRKAVECDPENKNYQKMLGFCLARAGQTDEALAVFYRCVGKAEAHYDLARMLYEMNRDAEARQHLQTAVQESPNFEPAQRLLAQLEGREPADPAVTRAGFETPAGAVVPSH
jgi:tetratricopeptide (TPR) repeat protein